MTRIKLPPGVYFAGSPITGESDRFTYVTFHDKLASIEKMMKTMDKVGDTLMKNASWSAQGRRVHWRFLQRAGRVQQGASYRPDMIPLAHTMWWSAELVGLRPGCEAELKTLAKPVIDMHKKAGDNDHWTAYEIRGGIAEPAVLFVTTMRWLADDDQEPQPAAKEIFENPMAKQAFNKFDHECVTYVESTYLRVEPSLSRPPQSLVAADSDFWTIKEEAPAVATKTKSKKPAVEPAALKQTDKKP